MQEILWDFDLVLIGAVGAMWAGIIAVWVIQRRACNRLAKAAGERKRVG